MTMPTLDATPPDAPRTLQILAVAGRSYSYVWDQRGLLLPPLAVVFLIEYVVAIAAELARGKTVGTALISVIAISVAGIVGLMTFAVGLHRTVLLHDIRRGVGFLRVDNHFRGYAWSWIKIFGIAILCSVVGALVLVALIVAAHRGGTEIKNTQLLTICGILPLLAIIIPRFSLALPAAALGEDGTLRHAWRLTRGNWLRIIGVLALAILPFTLLGLMLELPALGAALMSKLVPNMAVALDSLRYVIAAFSAALRAISTAVLTVTLSLSYAALTRPADFQE